MQAIHTYYLGPTNNRGSRIVAKAAGRLVFPWRDELSAEANHAEAAKRYAIQYQWPLDKFFLASGGMEDGSIVHVLVAKNSPFAVLSQDPFKVYSVTCKCGNIVRIN